MKKGLLLIFLGLFCILPTVNAKEGAKKETSKKEAVKKEINCKWLLEGVVYQAGDTELIVKCSKKNSYIVISKMREIVIETPDDAVEIGKLLLKIKKTRDIWAKQNSPKKVTYNYKDYKITFAVYQNTIFGAVENETNNQTILLDYYELIGIGRKLKYIKKYYEKLKLKSQYKSNPKYKKVKFVKTSLSAMIISGGAVEVLFTISKDLLNPAVVLQYSSEGKSKIILVSVKHLRKLQNIIKKIPVYKKRWKNKDKINKKFEITDDLFVVIAKYEAVGMVLAIYSQISQETTNIFYVKGEISKVQKGLKKISKNVDALKKLYYGK